MTSTTTDECARHPGVTSRLVPCRLCQRQTCPDCRESQYTGGVPIVVCSECADRARRRHAMRKASIVVAAVVVVAAIIAAQFTPVAILLPMAFGALWLVIVWRRLSHGVASPWDALAGLWIFGRWFP